MVAKDSLSRYYFPVLMVLGGVLVLFAVFPSCLHALETSLHRAAAMGDVIALRRALNSGAQLDARDSQGSTALMIATQDNHIDLAQILIEAGSDVNAQNAMRNSPYLYAGARGFNEILRLTLAHGADLTSTNRYGGTALIPAAERGHVETVRLLIDAGVNVDHVNNLGWTALLEAILLGTGGAQYVEIVRLLIEAGGDVNLADFHMISPLQHARRLGFRDIEALLIKAGAR